MATFTFKIRSLTAFFLLLLLSGQVLIADNLTQSVRGRVIDKQTLQPLPGANIVIPDSDPLLGTASNNDGYFNLRNVPVGRIDIRITYVGYQEVYLLNIEHISGKETILNIEMEEKFITGEEVIISASGDKSKAINTLTSISARSFTVEETNKFAGSRGDVARMASNYAGVVNNNDGVNFLAVRGNTPAGLMWRLEGIEIPNPNHWGYFGINGGPMTIVNNNVLANSDFLSGAFPAEYGNATASIFDLKMRNGNNENYEHLFQVGFSGFELGSEGPVLKESKGSYLVNLRYSTMELFEQIMNFGTIGVPQFKDLAIKINIPNTSLGSFSVFGIGGLSKIEMLNSLRTEDDIDFYGEEGFDLINSAAMGIIGVNHIVSINPSVYLSSTVALSHRNFVTYVDSIIPPNLDKFTVYDDDLRENRLSGNFSINARLDNRNIVKGGLTISARQQNLNIKSYSYEFEQLISFIDSEGTGWLLQPYVHWQHRLSNNLVINSGLHYQNYLLNNSHSLEPRLGARYNFLPNQSLNFGVGRHSQILPEYFYHHQVYDGTNYHAPNKNLGMFRSDHVVLGYDRNFNGHTRMKIETYYQKLFDVPVNSEREDSYSMLNFGANSDVAFPDTLNNDGIGQNIGIELTIERFFHKGFYYLFTASAFDSKYRGSDGQWRNTAFNSNYIGNLLAGYEVSIGSTASKKRFFDFNIKMTYAGGQRYVPFDVYENPESGLFYADYRHNEAFMNRHKEYFRTDISIGYKVNTKNATYETIIEATNIFDNKNIFNASFDNRTGEEKYIYQLPRMIIPTFRVKF